MVLPPAVSAPPNAIQAFDPLLSDRPFVGFASRVGPASPLLPRSVCVELRSAASGRKVALLAIPQELFELPQDVLWAPAEFMVHCSEAGLAGAPALVSGSGVEAVDLSLANALSAHWPGLEKLGRLTPGSYRVLLGP